MSVAAEHAFQHMQDGDVSIFKDLTIAPDGGLSGVSKLLGQSRVLPTAITLIFVALNSVSIMRDSLPIAFGTDIGDRQGFFYPGTGLEVRLLAWFELIGVTVLVSTALWNAFRACTLKAKDMLKWKGVADLFWDNLPALQGFSALRLLMLVHPQILSADFIQQIKTIQDMPPGSKQKRMARLHFAVFAVWRLFIFMFGFEAFCIKFANAAKLLVADPGSLETFVKLVLFLNQMLCIVRLNIFATTRIHLFVFGGENAEISEEEGAILVAWKCCMAKSIWRMPTLKDRICVSLTFSDVDFQKLVLHGNLAGVTAENFVHRAKAKLREFSQQLHLERW